MPARVGCARSPDARQLPSTRLPTQKNLRCTQHELISVVRPHSAAFRVSGRGRAFLRLSTPPGLPGPRRIR